MKPILSQQKKLMWSVPRWWSHSMRSDSRGILTLQKMMTKRKTKTKCHIQLLLQLMDGGSSIRLGMGLREDVCRIQYFLHRWRCFMSVAQETLHPRHFSSSFPLVLQTLHFYWVACVVWLLVMFVKKGSEIIWGGGRQNKCVPFLYFNLVIKTYTHPESGFFSIRGFYTVHRSCGLFKHPYKASPHGAT